MKQLPGMGRGVLEPAGYADKITVARFLPSAALAEYVKYYWSVRWSLPPGASHEIFTLPSPHINFAIDGKGGTVHGVCRGRFRYLLEGTDCVLGTQFHAGAFRCFLDSAVDTICDQVVPAQEVFGQEIARLAPGPSIGDDLEQRAKAVDTALQSYGPTLHEGAELVRRCVDRIESDSELTRVDQIAKFENISSRTLQRYFKELVGVSPKWVIRRYRLRALAESLEASEKPDLANLAVELGYSDQAHLTRDFKGITGTTPQIYARRNGASL